MLDTSAAMAKENTIFWLRNRYLGGAIQGGAGVFDRPYLRSVCAGKQQSKR